MGGGGAGCVCEDRRVAGIKNRKGEKEKVSIKEGEGRKKRCHIKGDVVCQRKEICMIV